MILNKKITISLVFLFLTTLLWNPAFSGEIVNLTLTPKNSSIGFKLDSTFQLVHGNAPKFEGKVQIPKNLNPDEFYVEVNIPVKDMETANEKRDKTMHNFCFEMEKYPEIRFESTAFKELPAKPRKDVDFEFTLMGNLTIKGITKSIAIPVTIKSKENSFHASGTVTLNYLKDFNIKDPSVFILRVAKQVEVFVEVDIPHNLIGNPKQVLTP